MSEPDPFAVLSAYFDDIPDAVRSEISLLLTALADDRGIDSEGWTDCEWISRGLFGAQTRYGRFGDLIKAVGAIDVYFAADTAQRFGSAIGNRKGRGSARLRNHYAGRLAAIERARTGWQALRQSSLSAASINAAMTADTAALQTPVFRANQSAARPSEESRPENRVQR